jgi:hypothetical protein
VIIADNLVNSKLEVLDKLHDGRYLSRFKKHQC